MKDRIITLYPWDGLRHSQILDTYKHLDRRLFTDLKNSLEYNLLDSQHGFKMSLFMSMRGKS